MSDDFFKGKKTISPEFAAARADIALQQIPPETVKQQMRRNKVIKSAVVDLLCNRVQPNTKDGILFAYFDEFEDLKKDPRFKPLSSYIDKLVRRDKNGMAIGYVRPILANEAGIIRLSPTEGKIVVLKEK